MNIVETSPRIAVLGAGRVGSALARVTVEAGYPVSVSASRGPDDLELIASVVMPGATPMWTADAIAAGDVVVLAIPLHRFPALDPALFADKIVVDGMNYWPPIDGRQEFFERGGAGSSEIVQDHLSSAHVVKTFNHLGYHEIEDDRRPVGDADRRALGVAGDDRRAVELVASIVDRIGFDPVTFTSLRDGRAFQPGEPAFGNLLTRPQFLELVPRRVAA
ncbi:NADPH-dependent F420 reductase [Streptomyces sp. NPDC047453]|uniref:NADPH-dependent F420 reductase n=1 Tax=Streptomyces sp. NPDC047453 TaxID=3154812 RepID=UPI0033F03365